MPVILRFKNIKFIIIPGDHGYPHVHILGKSAECKFRLDEVKCMDNKGFSKKAINQIEKQVVKYQDLLLDAWHEWQN